MTTNQTIDGVPRELAELCAQCLSNSGYCSEANTLRALLVAPPRPDWKTLHAAMQLQRDHWRDKAMGSQPQGEPVEIGYIEHSKEFDWNESGVNNRLIWTMPMDQRHKIPQHYKVMLYAEQPAPVAVALPERLTAAELEELEVIEAFIHGQGLSNLA